jgi:hypothetical protein
MTFRPRVLPLAVACACLSLTTACAAGPQITMPRFDHLEKVATDSVNITIGRLPLAIASRFVRDEEHPELPVLLRGLRSVHVRSFEFPMENMYSQADIEFVRDQLSGPGWTPLAQIRQRRRDDAKVEDVDVFVAMEEDKIEGLIVIASSPRAFTIVNVDGTLDPAMLAELEDRFGLPASGL